MTRHSSLHLTGCLDSDRCHTPVTQHVPEISAAGNHLELHLFDVMMDASTPADGVSFSFLTLPVTYPA
ncbi:hypothetical protein [Paenibacillus hexagrammi]|uniref:Uncharacterized protein n=1 Tax=Paenibacillus hexagrammi TaxID=2908839 RepID=A0ABY3SGR2_9BACL|nr:hypothetical protein [Paenibacillus sp. YPD9-1]UJF32290.1 hypothetical protein L0M14_21600 [Paenibacillus sp. YPD9-1]